MINNEQDLEAFIVHIVNMSVEEEETEITLDSLIVNALGFYTQTLFTTLYDLRNQGFLEFKVLSFGYNERTIYSIKPTEVPLITIPK